LYRIELLLELILRCRNVTDNWKDANDKRHDEVYSFKWRVCGHSKAAENRVNSISFSLTLQVILGCSEVAWWLAS